MGSKNIIYDRGNIPRSASLADILNGVTEQDASGDMTIRVSIISERKAPTDIQISNQSVLSGSGIGTRIGIITVVDGSSSTHTLEILADDDEKFEIESSAGVNYLILRAPVDYDTAPSHQVTIRATNEFDLAYSEVFTITVTPVYTNTTALNYNGIDEYTSAGDTFNYDIANAFSVALWIKPDNLAATRILFSKAGAAPTVRGYILSVSATTGALFVQMRTGTTNTSHTFDSALTAGSWQFVVFTYAGGNNLSGASAYVDAIKNTTSPSGALSGTMLEGQAFIFGQRNGSVGFLSATMDEMTVWSKELTQPEVTELYNGGVPNDPASHSASGSLVSWHRHDGDTIPTIIDHVGSNDLTAVNMDSGNLVGDVP